jgi:hypothetical protein
MCVGDPFLTPIRWNAIADAWWGLSGFKSPAERNFLARLDEPFIIALAGDQYETLARAIVGMFRRAHVNAPTPFSQHILDIAMRKPLFRLLWDEHTVADEPWETGGPHERIHPAVGPVLIHTVKLAIPLSSEIIVAVSPADEPSAKAFDRLREIGHDSRAIRMVAPKL